MIFINFRPDRARELTRALLGQLPEDASMDLEARVSATSAPLNTKRRSGTYPSHSRQEIDMPSANISARWG